MYNFYHNFNRKILKISSLFGLVFLLTLNLYGQDKVPPNLSYQAVARDNAGMPIKSRDVVLEVTIHKYFETGPVVWRETHNVTTSEYGMLNVEIGDGVSTFEGSAYTFEQINWAEADHFIEIKVDFGAEEYGNGLVDMGTVKLQSVPYAFVSDTTLHAPMPEMSMSDLQDVNLEGLTIGQTLKWNGTTWEPRNAVEGSFVTTDGLTDMDNDWTISKSFNFTHGSLNLQEGSITLPQGTLTANNLQGNFLKLNLGVDFVSEISDDNTLGGEDANNQRLVTQQAIKEYIDENLNADQYWTGSANFVYNINQQIGIGTGTPYGKFHVEAQKKVFLVTGEYDENENIVINWNNVSRMVFYPSKAAFRSGKNSSTTNGSIGLYSTAFGEEVIASGKYSFGAGWDNEASGAGSVVLGAGNLATGTYSFALGRNTESTGAYAFAMNYGTTATGDNSLAMGENTTTGGDNSFAGGFETVSAGLNSFSFGEGAEAISRTSFAIGLNTKVTGKNGFAAGNTTKAASFAEFVIGQFNTQDDDNSTPDAWIPSQRLLILGNGTSEAVNDRNDAVVVWKDGKFGIGTSNYNDFTNNTLLVVAGDIIANGQSITSDKRYKKDVATIDNALATVLAMRGVTYFWNNNDFPKKKFSDKRQFGFIAQEVETIAPELVTTDGNGYKAVDYARVNALLVEAVKSQQTEIEELKTGKKEMENELQELKTQVNLLMQKIDAK